MDANTIMELRPALTEYLHTYDECFGRWTARRHLDTYVEGQLGDLQRKSVEPIADRAGVPARTLQQFLSLYRWDEPAMRDQLQQRVARLHADPSSVGIIDEGSFVKKGDKTACVQRQHCGTSGKLDNCMVSVHLGYATPDFHTLLDGEPYLPKETWGQDRERCRQAAIPDEVVYRSKWLIALDQFKRAVANGVRFAWLTFDEWYGGKPPFLRELDGMGQNYVAEVPADLHVWTAQPPVLYRDHARDKPRPGRRRRYPRLKVQHNPTVEVRNALRHSPILRHEPWVKYHVKDGSKGPMVWEAKRITVYLKDEHGLPGAPHHLLVARNVTNPDEIKFFISNAPPQTPTETLLPVAFSRWKIERMFEDSKQELGMDHFEVRKYGSICRHLILSCVSHLFLAEFRQEHRGEKSRPDDQSGARGDLCAGRTLGAWGTLFAEAGRNDRRANPDNAGPQRQSRAESPQANDPTITRSWDQAQRVGTLSMETLVAL